MNKLVIRLKSGKELAIFCEECSITKNGLGIITNIRFEKCHNIRPLILDPTDIELMYEVIQTEPQTDGILFKGDLKEGEYKLIKTTDGWVLEGEDIVYCGWERGKE